jgi:hypothetical protein
MRDSAILREARTLPGDIGVSVLTQTAGTHLLSVSESVDHAPPETPPCEFEFAKTLHAETVGKIRIAIDPPETPQDLASQSRFLRLKRASVARLY